MADDTMSTVEDMNIRSRLTLSVKGDQYKFTNISIPHRGIGTLSHVDPTSSRFGIVLKMDDDLKIDDRTLDELRDYVHNFYSEKVHDEPRVKNQLTNHVSNPKVGKFYGVFLESLNRVVRVKLVNNNADKSMDANQAREMDVLLIDYGMQEKVGVGSLFELDKRFFQHPYNVALSLVCQLPDDRLVEMFNLPKMDYFKEGDHVEVIILSNKEPCLAIIGASTSRMNSIHRDLLSACMDERVAGFFQRVLTLPLLPIEKCLFKGWEMNTWSYQHQWTLVTVVSSFNASSVAVRDVFTSLRFLFLQETINRSYRQPDFRAQMMIDASRISCGSPVVVHVPSINSFIRGTISSICDDTCNVQALDIPDMNVMDLDFDSVFYPSSLLLLIPPQLYHFKCVDEEDQEKVSYVSVVSEKLLQPHSIAVVKLHLEDTLAEMENGKNMNVTNLLSAYMKEMEFPIFRTIIKPPVSSPTSIDWDDINDVA